MIGKWSAFVKEGGTYYICSIWNVTIKVVLKHMGNFNCCPDRRSISTLYGGVWPWNSPVKTTCSFTNESMARDGVRWSKRTHDVKMWSQVLTIKPHSSFTTAFPCIPIPVCTYNGASLFRPPSKSTQTWSSQRGGAWSEVHLHGNRKGKVSGQNKNKNLS